MRRYPAPLPEAPKNILIGDGLHTGQEIKDWVWYHMVHDTSQSLIAETMKSAFNLYDHVLYKVEQRSTIAKYPDVVAIPQNT